VSVTTALSDPRKIAWERRRLAAARFWRLYRNDRNGMIGLVILTVMIAVAVTDFCAGGLSAVYTYFDTGDPARALGTYAILSQIRLARERALEHLYLGFWIEGHPKMDYKSRFRPLEVLRNGIWSELPDASPSPAGGRGPEVRTR